MKCPICNSGPIDVGPNALFQCGSIFDAITGEPRLELLRGHQCVASCGVCGETLPHHVSHCAGVLKRKLTTPPATRGPKIRKFCELPIGTRFRYRGGETVWVLLDQFGRFGYGLVAKWTGVDGPTTGQQVCSAVDNPPEAQTLEVEVVEN